MPGRQQAGLWQRLCRFGGSASLTGPASLRIDRLLWFLRFARSRSLAQQWIGKGHIRCNGERVTRMDRLVSPGDVLTLPLAREVIVIELTSIPTRRGPPDEARSHYRELDAG